MLRCNECGEDNDDDARRCTQCGRPLVPTSDGEAASAPHAGEAPGAEDTPTGVRAAVRPSEEGTPTRVLPARPTAEEDTPTRLTPAPAPELCAEKTRIGTLPGTPAADARGAAELEATRVRPAEAPADAAPAGAEAATVIRPTGTAGRRSEELEATGVRPGGGDAGGDGSPDLERSRATGPHEATLVSRAATCAACNGPVRAGWRFCKSCGAPLAETGALPAWRHVLVEVARPGGPARRTHSLEGAVTVLGRRLADVVLQDGSVSGSHAAFEVEAEACHLRDLDSTNGTFVAVRGFETLWPGAVVLVGPHRLLYRRRDHESPDARELALVTTGGREKATFPLHSEAVVVGTTRSDIVLPAAPGVAKRHAEIAWTGTTHAVRGLSANHPTWLLVRRRRTLQDQDRVRIGDTVYEYRRQRA